jgi:hypothetical protein
MEPTERSIARPRFPLPWPLRLLQQSYWLSLVAAGGCVAAIMVFAGGHDVLDPTGRRAWSTAALLAGTMFMNTALWVASIVGVQAWRRRWYEEIARRARPADPLDEAYAGYKIACLECLARPPRTAADLCFRPINHRAAPYGVDAVSQCLREGVGVLCAGGGADGHKCGFHAVRDPRLIGPGSPAQVEWDLDRRRRRSQVLRVGFQRECSACRRRRPAEHLTVERSAGHDLVVPVCGRHRHRESFSPIDLANRLGTEVGWIDSVPRS